MTSFGLGTGAIVPYPFSFGAPPTPGYAQRDQVYKKLSLKRKEDLLSQLAFETFERGDYFFKQATVEQHIIRYICNLPGASEDEEALQLDGEAVLKSIEAQHGLLVERARGIYSFSHLTFQEYFTAQQVISPTIALNQALRNLATHITDKRYREIFLLTAGMLPQADSLLMLMKQHTDQLMVDEYASELKLQLFLAWVQQKASSVDAACKLTLVRFFYFTIDRSIDLNSAHNFDLDFDHDLDLAIDNDIDLDLFLALDLVRTYKRSLNLDLRFLLQCIEQTLNSSNVELKFEIQVLRAELPSLDDIKVFKQWWHQNSDPWAEKFRSAMVEHRNLGHAWNFSESQKEKMQRYYDANKFLIDCLNSDCYVTKATRQYIEDTLLLPLSEIEKYPVPDAIANL